jgi:6-phosphogluconolactonase/glucosamine-6-phosphate isomerase/deaminase
MEQTRQIGHLKVYVRKNIEDAAAYFAKDISRKLVEFRDVERRDVLFLTSGGSALTVLDRIDHEAIGPYLTIGIFDERFDPSNRTSNYAQLRKTHFYKRAVQKGCRLIDTETRPSMTMESLAQYYEEELRHWKRAHPRGAIMATMGVAQNGHTAGIMPFPENPDRFHQLFETERWITSYDVEDKDPFRLRVTTTYTFLRSVDLIGIYMVGSKKGSMLRELMKNGSCAELPGRIIKELPRGAVYMDQALYDASGLSEEK